MPKAEGPAAVSAAQGAAPTAWDGLRPFACTAGEVTLTRADVHGSAGAAIRATGTCHLRLLDSKITAPLAIEASRAAVVEITRSQLDGWVRVIEARDEARVVLVDSTVTGPLRRRGTASIEFGAGAKHVDGQVVQYEACRQCLSYGAACDDCKGRRCRECIEHSEAMSDPSFCIPACRSQPRAAQRLPR